MKNIDESPKNNQKKERHHKFNSHGVEPFLLEHENELLRDSYQEKRQFQHPMLSQNSMTVNKRPSGSDLDSLIVLERDP